MEHVTKMLHPFGMELTKRQREQMIRYRDGILQWNDKVNLTAITEPQDFEIRHFADSLSIAGETALQDAKRVIDVGTGAGFPGIPLAILFPQKYFTLVDSLGKRIKIISGLAEEIGLCNVEFVHARAEDLAQKKEHREQYDICVSRAVAHLTVLSEYCLPFVREGGFFAPYKTASAEEEIEESKTALFLLGGKLRRISSFKETGTEHTVLWIEKIKKTPSKYPRKAGTPSKEPLK